MLRMVLLKLEYMQVEDEEGGLILSEWRYYPLEGRFQDGQMLRQGFVKLLY